MDFEPLDSITYRTFQRAFDTHPEECSSGTFVVGTDDNDCHIIRTESGHNAIPEIDEMDYMEAEDIGEVKDGAEERKEYVEVKVKVEVQQEEEKSKTDVEREEERNKEERRKVVAESMILYTAQLKSQKEKDNDTDTAKIKGNEVEEARSEARIEARKGVDDDDGDEDYEEMKVEKEGAFCNCVSCISTMLLPYLLDITPSIMCRESSSLALRPTLFLKIFPFSFAASLSHPFTSPSSVLCPLYFIISTPPSPFPRLPFLRLPSLSHSTNPHLSPSHFLLIRFLN